MGLDPAVICVLVRIAFPELIHWAISKCSLINLGLENAMYCIP